MKTLRSSASFLAVAAVVLGSAQALGSSSSVAAQSGATVREFDLTAERFTFTPDHLEVNQGDTVRITARSADGTHGFAIRKLKVEKTIPRGGDPVVIEFVASKAGSFVFKCSEYCGRGHDGMRGLLVVNPAGHRAPPAGSAVLDRSRH